MAADKCDSWQAGGEASPSPPGRGGKLPPPWRQVALLAADELREAWAARWLPAFAVAWLALALFVARSALTMAGSDVPGFEVVAAAQFDLAVVLLPLAGVTLGAVALSSEGEGMEILWLQPVGRGAALLGRILGLLAATGGAVAVGFLATFVGVGRTAGPDRLELYVIAAFLGMALAVAFLGLGALLAVALRSRMRAVAGALTLWLALVLAYDAALMAIALGGGAIAIERSLPALVLANPVDASRVAFLLAAGSRSFGGPVGAALARDFAPPWGAAVLGADLVAWIGVPVLLSIVLIRRRDL